MSFHHKRSLRITINGNQCVYCGERASVLDHFPPKDCGLLGFLLPACRQCNGLAGTDWPYNFEKRAELVKGKLAFRYQRALRIPDWTDAEISELRGRLQTTVIAWVVQKKIAQRRLAWNAVSYLASIDRGKHFVPSNAETGTTLDIERNLFAKLVKQDKLLPNA